MWDMWDTYIYQHDCKNSNNSNNNDDDDGDDAIVQWLLMLNKSLRRSFRAPLCCSPSSLLNSACPQKFKVEILLFGVNFIP